jgi:NADH-quinone oxidoreductase subunit H
MAAMVPVILAGSLGVGDIVRWQATHHMIALWPVVPGLPAFVIFFMALLAESNRIPFDVPEAESELVAGVTTEYTGIRFTLFYLAEYVHTLVGSAIAAALFLGGWDGPFWPGLHWMVGKTLLLFAAVYWVRWSLLRLRSDQLLALCWRVLVPASLLLVLAAAAWVQLFPEVR